MATILGLDLGTTSLEGVLLNTDQKRVVATASAPNDAGVPGGAGHLHGRNEQAPARIAHQAANVIRQLSKTVRQKGMSVDGIGLTGQMHGMLVVDEQRQPLSDLVTWLDGRADDVTSAVGISYIEEMIDRCDRATWAKTGCLPATGYMAATLYWMMRNDVVPAKASKVTFVHDWFAAELADVPIVTDPSGAASAGIFDLTAKCWSSAIVSALGLPAAMLPEVRESGAVIGKLSRRWADELGLSPGIPICNALGDNQASFIGSVANRENSVLVNIGTGGQISWLVDDFLTSDGMDLRYLPIDKYLVVGASLCGGKAYSWLADFYAEVVEMVTGERPAKHDIYEVMNRMAPQAIPRTLGLRVEPTLMGTRADPRKRGSIVGIDQINFSPANLTRAVLEGMVEELWQFYLAGPPQTRAGHTRVIASGNGVRRSPLLGRAIARRFGLPVFVPQHTEEASFGASLAAAVGIGVFEDFAQAGAIVHYLGAIA